MTVVRKASLADVSAIGGFIGKKAAFDRGLDGSDGQLRVNTERIGKAMFGVPVLGHALLVSKGTQPIGMAFYQYRFSPFEARASLWIDALFVDESARRNGCGTALMHALAREASLRDCVQLSWQVSDRNTLAIAFFTKLDATVVSRQDRMMTYAIPSETLNSRGAEKRAQQTRPPIPKPAETRPPEIVQFGVPQRLTSYKTLVAADTYRDGGSLEVRFICADGTFETIWLQASLDPEFGVRYIHTDLQIFADANRDGASCRIGKQSPQEEAVVDSLNHFLRSPKVAVPFSHRTDDEHYLKIVESLLESIPNRVPTE